MDKVTPIINKILALELAPNDGVDIRSLIPETDINVLESQRIEMIMNRTTDTLSDYYCVFGHGVAAIHRQNIQLTGRTWELMKTVLREAEVELRQRKSEKYRIGVEIVSTHCKVSKAELFQYYRTTENTADELFEYRFFTCMNNLLSPAWNFALELNHQLATSMTSKIKKFLKSEAVIAAAQETVVEILGNDRKPETKSVIEWIDKNLSIYFADESLGYLRGVTIRNGFLLIKGALVFPLADQRGYADLLSLAAHEFGHFVVRRSANIYSFSTPVSMTEDEPRLEEAGVHGGIEGKPKESGREITLKLFDAYEPSWIHVTDPNVGRRFVDEALNGKFKKCPIRGKDEGIPARTKPTLSFACTLRDGRAHIE